MRLVFFPKLYLLALIVVSVGCILLYCLKLIRKIVAPLRWKREHRRRQGLQGRALATVQECSPITEAGHTNLILSFDATEAPRYRDASQPQFRFRAIIVLPPEAYDYAAAHGKLPVRFNPVDTRNIALDWEEILSDRAQLFERETYLKHGPELWERR